MKLSCLPVSLYPDFASGRVTLDAWFRTARDLGLDGADVSVAHVRSREPGYLTSIRRAADAARIDIAILVTYSDFTHPDPSFRARQVEDVRAWIDAARHLGVEFLRLTAGQAYPAVSEEDGLRWSVEGLTACLTDARSAGVRLLYENHARGSVWQHHDFTQPSARFLEVARRTAGTALEILFDTANPLALDENAEAVLDGVIERVGAIHLSDLRRRGTFEPTVIGTGAAPLGALLRRLVGRGFDGWMSIEEGSRTGTAGFERAVAFADRAWADAGGRPRATRPLFDT